MTQHIAPKDLADDNLDDVTGGLNGIQSLLSVTQVKTSQANADDITGARKQRRQRGAFKGSANHIIRNMKA